MYTLNNIFEKMNWGLLRHQKLVLLHLTDEDKDRLTPDEVIAVEGIICLMNDIQDIAVDELGYPEDEVFHSEPEPVE